MRNNVLKLYMKMRNLTDAFLGDESGQDLVEYALVLALIALAATASMKTLATTIGTAFTSVGTKLTTYTS
jgi:pilus assembly protein Flp/PilA